MTTVSYDLDTSGGLMPLIRSLIKPPDEEINAQKPKKPQHPYYKRPGKGHNHDSCDACGEGGDLICCDRCPASFHLGCYDPPLDENDIPAGLWLCRECCSAEEKAGSSRGSRAQSPAEKSDSEKKPRLLRNNRTSSTKGKDKEDKKKKQEETKLSPMEILVKAAKIMNPKQFELPRELRVPCPFPGTEKDSNGSSVVNVDSWGCVPLPAKTCFVCDATCKRAPLLQCDYCPLLFHQDCLDPPLTTLPTGRWMCPNHVEQFIDWKLVNSGSAMERVALWDKFSGPLDQHAVKIDFLRRARNKNPRFRIKVGGVGRSRVGVPEMVRHHYRCPPPLLPARREYVRCLNVLKTLRATSECGSEDETDGPTHKICMNLSCPQYSGTGRCGHDTTTLHDKDLAEPTSQESRSSDSSELSDMELECLTASVKRRKVSREDKSPPKRGGGRGERLELRDDGNAEQLLAIVDEQLKKLDARLVKLLAWQRLQQVLVGEQCVGRWSGAGVGVGVGVACAGLVSRSVDRSRLSRAAVPRLALPSDLLTRGERDRIARAVWGPPPAHPAPVSPGHSLSDAVVRATLCPLITVARNGVSEVVGRPIPMRLSRLTVGVAGGCDVLLDRFRCLYVSHNHATIFYDEVSGQFEVINYSEWGTRVNGVLYACDVSRHGAPPPPADDEPAPSAALQDLLRRRERSAPRVNGNLVGGNGAGECSCEGAPSASGAWEGSALLSHGALLQFGCLSYVFSVPDHRAFPYEEPVEDPEL